MSALGAGERAGWTRRPKDAHKNRNGRVLVVAGSRSMPGAAALAIEAAYRSGCGYVLAACPGSLVPTLVRAVPNAVLRPMGNPMRKEFAAADHEALLTAMEEADAVLFGPGWGAEVGDGWFVEVLIEAQRRFPELRYVLDADALNVIGAASAMRHCGPTCVLTPHPGEAARLLGKPSAEVIQADRAAAMQELLAAAAGVIVLKGNQTQVGQRDSGSLPTVVDEGGPELATAGTGDVLGGILAALLARGIQPLEASLAAVRMHARAGASARELHGSESVTAQDLLPQLGRELDALLDEHAGIEEKSA